MRREQTLSSIPSRFWIPASRGLIHYVIKHCLYCKREKATPVTPYMANVPLDRFSFNKKPFTKTGVDYLVPCQIMLSKGTRSNQATAKRYIVPFTRLSTRAVHLEIAEDLSLDLFILFYRRFLARRGTVKVMRPDSGRNFVGASAEQKQVKCKEKCKDSRSSFYQQTISSKKIDWKLNLPVSPWMGGIWESLVNSVKLCLKAIINGKLFIAESLATFICEVEPIINQRPIVPVSDDASDFEVLTTNHFIIESDCYNFSPGVFEKQEINLCRK